MDKIVEKIIKTGNFDVINLSQNKGSIFTFLNPVSYLSARKNRAKYYQFDGIYADGFILTMFIKLFYGKKIQRCSFDMTSIAPLLFDYACKANKSVYIIGARQEEIIKAKEVLLNNYQGLFISGFRHGYFHSEKDIDHEINQILKINPDFVIVGMGVIKQESFLIKLKNKNFKGIGFSCGGFLHQTSKNIINYYPSWVNRLNIRFLYRIVKEKHTRIRYLKATFCFPLVFLFDRIKQKTNSEEKLD